MSVSEGLKQGLSPTPLLLFYSLDLILSSTASIISLVGGRSNCFVVILWKLFFSPCLRPCSLLQYCLLNLPNDESVHMEICMVSPQSMWWSKKG